MVISMSELSAAVAVVAAVVTVVVAVDRKANKKDVEVKHDLMVADAKKVYDELIAKVDLKQDTTDCAAAMEASWRKVDSLAAQLSPLAREVGEARVEIRILTALLKKNGGE